MRERALRHLAIWGDILIKQQGKYLGLFLGPGGDKATWDSIGAKMLSTAGKWALLEPGSLSMLLACNIYIYHLKDELRPSMYTPARRLQEHHGAYLRKIVSWAGIVDHARIPQLT